jgi:hypothetical protein
MTDFDTVVDALISELQDASALSYVDDDHIVKRFRDSETPGSFGNHAITVSYGGTPLPENRLGGRVRTTFTLSVKLFVRFAGATRPQLLAGMGGKAGLGTFMKDVQETLIQNNLGGVLAEPAKPLPGGEIEYEGEGSQTPTAKVVMTYLAEVREQKG